MKLLSVSEFNDNFQHPLVFHLIKNDKYEILEYCFENNFHTNLAPFIGYLRYEENMKDLSCYVKKYRERGCVTRETFDLVMYYVHVHPHLV